MALSLTPTDVRAAPDATVQQPPPATLPLDTGLDSQQAARFADHLLSRNDPFNALTWYRLALFLDPERDDAGALRFRIAYAYELGERWDAAEVAYGRVAEPSLQAQAAYRVAVVNHLAGRTAVADQEFANLLAYYPESPWASKAAYARGVMWLQDHDLPRAAQQFSAVPADHEPWSGRASTLATASEERIPSRSPAVAATLSAFIPGMGQIYSGHLGDGLMALAANGVLGAWSYGLIRQGVEQDRAWEVGLGSTIGSMFLLTWSSNMVGGWRSAKRFQDTAARHRADSLLNDAWDPTLELNPQDVSLP